MTMSKKCEIPEWPTDERRRQLLCMLLVYPENGDGRSPVQAVYQSSLLEYLRLG